MGYLLDIMIQYIAIMVCPHLLLFYFMMLLISQMTQSNLWLLLRITISVVRQSCYKSSSNLLSTCLPYASTFCMFSTSMQRLDSYFIANSQNWLLYILSMFYANDRRLLQTRQRNLPILMGVSQGCQAQGPWVSSQPPKYTLQLAETQKFQFRKVLSGITQFLRTNSGLLGTCSLSRQPFYFRFFFLLWISSASQALKPFFMQSCLFMTMASMVLLQIMIRREQKVLPRLLPTFFSVRNVLYLDLNDCAKGKAALILIQLQVE